MMSIYALIVTSKEVVARPPYNNVLTRAGQRVIVVKGEWGDTSRAYDGGIIPKDAKIFPSIAAAEKFARSWEEHPWYINGTFEVIEIDQVTEQVLCGYVIKSSVLSHNSEQGGV